MEKRRRSGQGRLRGQAAAARRPTRVEGAPGVARRLSDSATSGRGTGAAAALDGAGEGPARAFSAPLRAQPPPGPPTALPEAGGTGAHPALPEPRRPPRAPPALGDVRGGAARARGPERRRGTGGAQRGSPHPHGAHPAPGAAGGRRHARGC